jgi:hypothetical protein
MDDDLVQWLRAQLDEDERIARAAIGVYESSGRWWEDARFGSDGTVGDERGTVVVYRTGVGRQQATHIARHDPARVLREVEAKRILIAEHDREWCPHCMDDPNGCPTRRAWVLPYADRPGYREEWKP